MYDPAVGHEHTTAIVERYLHQLAEVPPGEPPSEPIVREMLAASLNRLDMLCRSMLYRSYPRLTRPPLNLQPEEMLGAVTERMLKAMREVRPHTVRQFFAIANQHLRWELNDMARRLDGQAQAVELRESFVAAEADGSESRLSPGTVRILEAIEKLPDEEREAFDLVRIQELTQPEAADVLGVGLRTVQRRLSRALVLLSEALSDLRSPDTP
jgi:RNA polymerase sigma-70 factor (ECF subfamily)